MQNKLIEVKKPFLCLLVKYVNPEVRRGQGRTLGDLKFYSYQPSI